MKKNPSITKEAILIDCKDLKSLGSVIKYSDSYIQITSVGVRCSSNWKLAYIILKMQKEIKLIK